MTEWTVNNKLNAWYQKRYHIKLPKQYETKSLLYFTTYSPISLFEAGEQGAWYDPSDLTTLFQDTAGTTPVTATGQSVGLLLDKSKGLVLGSELVVNGGFATDTDWTKGTGWTISGGSANFASGADNSDLIQAIGLPVIGTTYRITLSQTWTSGGQIRAIYGNQGYNLPAASGTYTFVLTASSAAESNIRFRALAGASVISIDNISVKELPGNHAVQATTANRPIYGIHPFGGRRNLLVRTEEFGNAAWTKTGTSTISAATVGQIFSCGATAASQLISANLAYTSNSVFTMSLKAKPAGSDFVILSLVDLTTGAFQRAWYNVSTGVVGASASGGATVVSPSTAISGPDADGFYRCSLSATLTSAANTRFALNISKTNNVFDGDATSGANINQSQLELGSLSNYQRVTDQYNVTEAGVPSVSYLFFDGVNDSMSTPTITPGVDKAQVFAGVRKLSNATTGTPFELGNTSNGGIVLFAPFGAANNYQFRSRGTISVDAASLGYTPPITNVVTGVGDISGDVARLRVNGTQVAELLTDQGTGNYLAYPLYIGARAGTSLFFSGHLYSLIARFGPNLDTGQISSTETWVAGKTGITI